MPGDALILRNKKVTWQDNALSLWTTFVPQARPPQGTKRTRRGRSHVRSGRHLDLRFKTRGK